MHLKAIKIGGFKSFPDGVEIRLEPGVAVVVGTNGSGKSNVAEAILASRPDELRALVEDAAGLGRFKRRRHRADLNLARVAAQTERARDLEAEVAKRLRPLALQATAAERAEKLAAEISSVRAGIAALDGEELAARLAETKARREAAQTERREFDARLESLL